MFSYLLLTALAARAYVSRPDIEPAPWNITFLAQNASLSDGYIFIAPAGLDTPSGLMIYDNSGQLLFCENDNSTQLDANTNFRVQKFEGVDYLTYWRGTGSAVQGHGNGFDIMRKSDYSVAFNISAPGLDHSDLHEFEITGDKALITQYPTVTGIDTSSIPGGSSDSFVFDGCFYQVDIRTGASDFKFCALEAGISIKESFLPITSSPNSTQTAWDYIHVNSVTRDGLGNYLLSGRHTSSLFYIDGRTGRILWRLGGKNSTFTGTGTDFKWQHHARFVGDPTNIRSATKRHISLFDNHANLGDQDAKQSRGLLLEINLSTNTTSIVQEYVVPEENLLTLAMGSTQFMQDELNLKSTNVLIGYGTVPVFAEFAQDGTPLRVVHFASSTALVGNYRAFKKAWIGKPTSPPDAVVQGGLVYVSWNGATEVRKWELRQGVNKGVWNNATHVSKTAFETAISLAADSKFVQLVGVDAKGKVLGQSAILDV